jgi:protein tyrosine/serine phosphatase
MNMYYFLALVLFVVLVMVGCRLNITSPMDYTEDVPNLVQIHPGVWRSGEPKSTAGWKYLKSLGIKKVIKLNYDSEGTDQGATDIGMEVILLSIPPKSDLGSTLEIPDSATVEKAVELLSQGGGILVHCTHGQDRTGLVVGAYRVKHDGWTKEAAWNEMVQHNFHQELLGLMRFWHRFNGSFPVVDSD